MENGISILHIHKCPPPVPLHSQLDPTHTPTSNFLKIHLIIISISMIVSPKWSLPSGSQTKKPQHAFPLLPSPLLILNVHPASNRSDQISHHTKKTKK